MSDIRRVPYLHRECYVRGDETRMQDTIDYWWNHVNAREYRKFREHFMGRICDIGCNIGMSSLLAANDPKVQQVVGVDVFSVAIEAARRYARFANLDDKVIYIAQDFTLECDQQLETESFDGVISFHTLEHIYPEDLYMFVGNLRRILKMGGKVLVSIPYGHNFNDPLHASHFDEIALNTLFMYHGFDVLNLYTTDSGQPYGEDSILTGLFVKSVMLWR